MPKAPLVSVILPAYNRLGFLRAAVDSVFNQGFADWELIIADDGSGPQTQDYLRTLGDRERISVLRLSHTGNPSAVRNAALRCATGEYVAFLDSDDLWMPGKLRQQIDSLRLRPGCGWGYTDFTLVDGSGAPLRVRQPAQSRALDGRILDQLVKEEVMVVTPSVVARRELIKRAGGYNETLRVCEDYELWIRLAERSPADFIDEPLVQVRRHGEHSFDDVTCLEHLRTVVEMLLRSPGLSHLSPVLRERRAAVSANLARAHARCGNRLQVLTTLLSSARYSWRFGRWWAGALASAARASAPGGALRAVRSVRRKRRAA